MSIETPLKIGGLGVLNQDRGSEDDIDFTGLIWAIWRGKFWILIAAALGFGWGWYRANVVATPMYTAQTVVAMETRDENVLDISGVVTGLPGTLGTINTELGVMRSRGLAEKLVLDLNLMADPEFSPWAREFYGSEDRTPTRRELDAVINRVLSRIAVENVSESYLFSMAMTTTDPEKSARIVNALARLYIEDQIEVKFLATEQATEWLTARLATLQDELEAAESAVDAFASENRITRVEELEALNLRIDDARDKLSEITAREKELGAQLSALAAAKVSGDFDAAALVAGDAAFERLVADGAPPAELSDRLDELRTRISVMRTRAAAQAETLASSITVLRADYAEQSDSLLAYQQLEREVVASRTIYEYFLSRLKELSAQQGNLRADSRIISAAAVPGGPSAPAHARMIAVATFAGLMAGIGLVLSWEAFHTGLRTAQELEAATGRPVLGQIPLVERTAKSEVISYFVEKPTSMAAESVRNLRTSILMSALDEDPQVIMMTSSLPNEGKTTTSIALAQNFTGLGKRVLLIEGDIRHRVFREYLDLTQTSGLLSVLSGEKSLIEAVERNYLIDADVLVGERTAMNAADVFSSTRFRALIAEARRIYDVVIIDTPPVLLVPDARVVGQLADAIVYAVEWNGTPKRDVVAGLRMMRDGGTPVTGLAMTRIDTKKLKSYGQYGGYGPYGNNKKYGRNYYET